MKVLTDYHHGGLFGSLHLLIEKRLGWDLFRPIGLDWFYEGYWRVAEPYGNAMDTVNQYLSIDDQPYIPYVFLNGNAMKKGEVYSIYDPENDIEHKAVTLETFKKMDIDLIIASHPLHEKWEELLQYHPKAKFIMQLGNEGQDTMAQNVLSSVWKYQPKSGQNIFYYHQEFDLSPYGYTEPVSEKIITNMIHKMPFPEMFDIYASKLPEFQFKSFGMGNRDGIPGNREDLVNCLKASMFGWHVKPADGYGHLIHQWYACGKPVITRSDFYSGKTGGLLLTDQETCIDLDRRSVEENVKNIRYWSEPENYNKMCQNAYKRFCDVVNFEDEAVRFKEWINRII